MGEIVDHRHDRLRPLRHRAERHRKEHREHHDLQDFILRHGIRNRGRDQMGQEFLDRERRHRQSGRLRLVWQRAREVRAGLQQIDHHEAEQQRYEGSADEPAHGLGKNPPQLGATAHMRNAADQRGEHQRRDDHLDQAQEQHRDQVHVCGDIRSDVGQIVVDQCPHHDAKCHRNQDKLRKPVRHLLTPVSPVCPSLADFIGDATRFAAGPRLLPQCSRCRMHAGPLASHPMPEACSCTFATRSLHQ